ncbi:MAG: hypothetical protein PHW96_02315 [Candidatus Nanoarchaeia archaeon]|nr:hypothetical protein [Candidatus Nanoarchaeia archaeon]
MVVTSSNMQVMDVEIKGFSKIYTLSPDRISRIKSSYTKNNNVIELSINSSTELRNLTSTEMVKEFMAMYEDNMDEIQASSSIIIKCGGNPFNPNIAEFVSIIRKIFYGLKHVEFIM